MCPDENDIEDCVIDFIEKNNINFLDKFRKRNKSRNDLKEKYQQYLINNKQFIEENLGKFESLSKNSKNLILKTMKENNDEIDEVLLKHFNQ